MIVSLETHRFQTLKQLREFVSSSGEASFRHTDRASAYAFCRRTLVQFRYSYTSLRRRDKGTVRSDLAKNVSLPRFRGHFILGGGRTHDAKIKTPPSLPTLRGSRRHAFQSGSW